MIIKTKYKLGDITYKIFDYAEKSFVNCSACNGTGKVALEGTKYKCPKCYGFIGEWVFSESKWRIVGAHTIGQVRAEITREDLKITYMCEETGIGSGTVHYEDSLFPDRNSAQKECDKRNERKENGAA